MNQNKQMIMNYYQNEILDYDKDFYNQYGIYVKPAGNAGERAFRRN